MEESPSRSAILKRAMHLAVTSANVGICTECGNEQAAEPDASGYECYSCEQPTVFGAEELLLGA